MVFEHTVLIATSDDPLTTDCLKTALAPFQDPVVTNNAEYCQEFSIYQNLIQRMTKDSLLEYSLKCFGNRVEVVPYSMSDTLTKYASILVADDDPKNVIDIIVYDNPNKRWSTWGLAGDRHEKLITKQGAEAFSCLVSDLDIMAAKLRVASIARKNYVYLQSILPNKNAKWNKWIDLARDKRIPIHIQHRRYLEQPVIQHLMKADKRQIFFGCNAMANIDDYQGSIEQVIEDLQKSIFLKQSILDARDINNPKWIDAERGFKQELWVNDFSDFLTNLEPSNYVSVVNCKIGKT